MRVFTNVTHGVCRDVQFLTTSVIINIVFKPSCKEAYHSAASNDEAYHVHLGSM